MDILIHNLIYTVLWILAYGWIGVLLAKVFITVSEEYGGMYENDKVFTAWVLIIFWPMFTIVAVSRFISFIISHISWPVKAFFRTLTDFIIWFLNE